MQHIELVLDESLSGHRPSDIVSITTYANEDEKNICFAVRFGNYEDDSRASAFLTFAQAKALANNILSCIEMTQENLSE